MKITKGTIVLAVLILVTIGFATKPAVDYITARQVKSLKPFVELKGESRVKFIKEKVESSGRKFAMPSDEELDFLDKNQDKVSKQIDFCANKQTSSAQTSCMNKLFEKYPGLYESLLMASALLP